MLKRWIICDREHGIELYKEQDIMKMRWVLGALSLLVATTVVGCDNEPKAIPVVFPDKSEVQVSTGERGVLEFSATHEWKLKVLDGEWLRFVADDTDVTGTAETSGVAGSASVKYYISDAALEDFTSSTAQVELTMENTSKIVFEVTRAPRIVAGAAMYTQGDNGATVIDKIEFVFNDSSRSVSAVSVGFSAKYDWEVTSLPEGVSFEGESFTGSQYAKPSVAADFKIFTLAADKVAYALPEDSKVVIRNRLNPEETYSFPVVYAGITNGNVVVISPMNMTTQGRNFSKEGYLLQPGTGEPYGDNRKTDVVTVICKDMDYTLAVVEYKLVGESVTAKELTGEDNWITATDDEKGNITFGVDENTGEERVAYLLVLPPAKAAEAKLNDGAWVGEIVRARGAIKITQELGKVTASDGFFVGWGSTQTPPASGLGSTLTLSTPAASYQVPADISQLWEYKFSDADIDVNGNLVVLPLAFKGQQWGLVKIRNYQVGNWQDVTITKDGVIAYPDGMTKPQVTEGAVRLGNIKATGSLRASILLFFKTDYRIPDSGFPDGYFDNMTTKADAALLLIQNP
jgi:hypothetical protein